MAAKTSWHRYGTKLRDCHPMYTFATPQGSSIKDVHTEGVGVVWGGEYLSCTGGPQTVPYYYTNLCDSLQLTYTACTDYRYWYLMTGTLCWIVIIWSGRPQGEERGWTKWTYVYMGRGVKMPEFCVRLLWIAPRWNRWSLTASCRRTNHNPNS